MSKKWFGGKGTGRPEGNAANDPIGTVRRAPDGEWIAIMWPSRPHPSTWAVTDYHGSVGYERPERIAHWPIVGAVPCSPAAGMALNPHKPDPPHQQWAVRHPEVTLCVHRSRHAALFTLAAVPGGVLVTRMSNEDDDAWRPDTAPANPYASLDTDERPARPVTTVHLPDTEEPA
jgi:hypothetical protein